MTTPLQKTVQLGTDFWNDSCSVTELEEAVAAGATGGTSNPVIVAAVVKNDPTRWNSLLDTIIRDFPRATEDEVAWMLIEEVGRQGARVLEPIFRQTDGAKGYLSMQVSPKIYRNAQAMLEQGRRLAGLAPNIAIKLPATAEGLQAAEDLTAEGINVNMTVSFSVSQAVATAEAFERGLERAKTSGRWSSRLHPYVTIMVGRVDDHLQRVMAKKNIVTDPGHLHWAGIGVFKKAYQIFTQRNYRSTLLAAAYRHHLHWSELVGPQVLMTMPYPWWKQFNSSDIPVAAKIETPLPEVTETELTKKFEDYRLATVEGAIKPQDFVHFGPALHTLNQFLTGYQELLAVVRARMLV